MSFGIAVKTDVADLSGWNQSQNSVYHSESRAENRNNGELFAVDNGLDRLFDRGSDLDVRRGQVSQRLVAHQHCDFLNQLAELVCTCALLAEQGYFVFD